MIQFQKILTTNIDDVMALSVNENQKKYVADNTYSLAEAYAVNNEGFAALPFAVYDDEELIGFIMFGYGDLDDAGSPEISKGNYSLWRLMVDKKYQGKGYSQKILSKAVEYIKTFPAGKAEYLWICYSLENSVAKHVYEKFGFIENGQMCGEEVVAEFKL